MKKYEKQLNKYIKDIQSNKIAAGELLKLSIERYKKDLKGKYELNSEVFERCCTFLNTFKHFVGTSRGKNFTLEGWELFIIANITSLYIKKSNKRKYQQSYIQVARKNGKTFLVSALALYYLIYDNEYSAEVVLAANTFQQSQLMYDVCQKLMNQLDQKCKHHKFHRGKDILFNPTNSKLHTIASKSRGLDGFNVSFAVIDEYHAAPDSSVKNVLVSSMGMRENPHLCIITTAGFDLESVCYQLRNDCVDVLKGLSPDNATFSAIFELDAVDELTDEKMWVKANPNLNITVKNEWLREQVNQSQSFKSEEVNVLTKNFNKWCNAADSWIDEKYLIFKELLSFNKDEVLSYVGIDLSSVSDLTAVNFMIIKDDMYYFDTRYYLPDQFKSVNNYREPLKTLYFPPFFSRTFFLKIL